MSQHIIHLYLHGGPHRRQPAFPHRLHPDFRDLSSRRALDYPGLCGYCRHSLAGIYTAAYGVSLLLSGAEYHKVSSLLATVSGGLAAYSSAGKIEPVWRSHTPASYSTSTLSASNMLSALHDYKSLQLPPTVPQRNTTIDTYTATTTTTTTRTVALLRHQEYLYVLA